MVKGMAEQWPKIEALMDAAGDNERLRDVLQYGTPQDKLAALERFGLSFEDLVFIHKELEKIVHQSPLRFWWW